MRLADRYRLVRRVGEGGGGGVWLVEDRLADNAVMVLKRLHAQAQASLAQWIVNEFQILAQLDLPTVAKVYDFGLASADAEDPGGAFFTRAFVDGTPLDDAFSAGAQPADAPRVRALFASAARTLRELHRLGVVHGDLKPANLIAPRAGDEVVLIDFGLAQGALGAAAHVRGGTLGFMAPERQMQLMAGEALTPDPRADVYALAMSLRCVLAGALLAPEAPTPPVIEKDGPLRALWDVATRGVAEDPARRFSTMDDLLVAMGEADARPQRAETTGGRVVLRPEGREHELGTMLDAVARRLMRREAGASALLLVGEEGSGRSTLFRELTWRAQLRGVQVLPVQGEPGEGPARRLREGAEILSGTRADPRDPDALVTAFRHAAGIAPVLILADDLDRADPAITSQLRSIAYGCEVSEALLVIASTEDPARVRHLEAGLQVSLAPLDASAVASLCEQILGAVEPAVVAAVHGRTGGLPLAVTEVLKALARDAAVSPADVERVEVPGRARDVAMRRALALDAPAREAAAAVSLLGSDALPEHLAAVGVALDAQESARAAGVLTVGPDGRWRTTQGALGASLLDAMDPPARAGLLQRVAEGLDRSDVAITTRCAAWARAGDVARARALLPSAVDSLRASGLPLAAARLMESVRAGDPSGTTAQALYEEAELLHEGGMVTEAEALAARLDDANVERALALKALLLRGRLRRMAGDNNAAEELLNRVAAECAEPDPDMAAEAMVECSRSMMARGDYAGVVARCEQAIRAARSPKVRASARAVGGVAAMYAGDAAKGIAMLEAARGEFATLALPREEATLLAYLAIGREKAGDLQGARAFHEQSLEKARVAGDLRAMVTARGNLGHIAQRVGDLGASIEHNEAALKLAQRAGLRTAALTTRLNMASHLIRIGSMERARSELDAALAHAKEAGHRDIVAAATLMLGYVTARGAEVDRGLGMIAEAETQFAELGQGDDAADALLDAAEVLVDRGGGGDVERAAEKVARAREAAGGALGLREARARMLEGGVALARADARLAMRALGEAVALAEKENDWEVLTQALAARALAHEATGAELHARRDRERAVELLEEKAALLPPDLRGAFWSVARRAALRAMMSAPGGAGVMGGASELSVGVPPGRRVITAHAGLGAPRPGASNTTGPTFIATDERLVLLLELSRRVGEESTLGRVLDQAVRSAVELTNAERGAVLLAAEGGGLEVRATVGTHRGDGPDEQFSRSIAETVWIDGEPVVTLNAQGDRRFMDFRSVHDLGIAAIAAVPIRVRGRTLGVLYVESRRRRVQWAAADVSLMMAFAEQAGIAVEHARVVEELEARTRELEAARQEIEQLLETRTHELEATKTSLARAQEALSQRFTPAGMVAGTQPMRKVFAVIERVRDSDVAVVIEGESGTGKELVARALHFSGARAKGPFVVVHCGAIPESLLESELFGHVRGAFTGADRDRRGLIASAHGGTLLFDEVAEMSPRMQVELLRVLQDRTVRPVGSEQDEKVDVRVLAATHRPLKDLVSEGRFREDLYYRLSVVTVRIPPLRERLDDIPALVSHFLAEFAREQGGPRKRLAREALAKLLRAPWPGNVRQLRHALESAAVLCEGDVIEAEALRVGEAETPYTSNAGTASATSAVASASATAGASPQTVRKVTERQRIIDALEQVNWNKVKAAQVLNMPRRTLYRRLREYGLLD